jgi:hypothetical protein
LRKVGELLAAVLETNARTIPRPPAPTPTQGGNRITSSVENIGLKRTGQVNSFVMSKMREIQANELRRVKSSFLLGIGRCFPGIITAGYSGLKNIG